MRLHTVNMHNPGACLSFPTLVNSLPKHEAWMWRAELSALCRLLALLCEVLVRTHKCKDCVGASRLQSF